MASKNLISLEEAMECVTSLTPIGVESVPIGEALGRILAEDVFAASDCPSVDSSLKDGFAVISRDIEGAKVDSPVPLKVIDSVTAGQKRPVRDVVPGSTVRIMTGSPMPKGATSVLSSEFAVQVSANAIHATAPSEEGRNVLKRGADVRAGDLILEKGVMVGPQSLGLLAAAGVGRIKVFARPRVAIAATGSELVPPGSPIGPGQVAASNMITLESTLKVMGIRPRCAIFRDSLQDLKERFRGLLEGHDVVLTCGGVLDGDKDFTVRAMECLGVEMLFRRVRIGPGKGICMGRLGERVIFNLPGGPPSNHVAGLVLAIPGIRSLMGVNDPFPPRLSAELTTELRGMASWTQFTYCTLNVRQGGFMASLPRARSRLMAMARSNGLIELPEGVSYMGKGERCTVWVTNWPSQ